MAREHPAIAALEAGLGRLPFGAAFCQFCFRHIEIDGAGGNIEAWFAPIAGTRVLVPFRLVIPTPLGTGVLEATQFVTQASPPRVAKTQ